MNDTDKEKTSKLYELIETTTKEIENLNLSSLEIEKVIEEKNKNINKTKKVYVILSVIGLAVASQFMTAFLLFDLMCVLGLCGLFGKNVIDDIFSPKQEIKNLKEINSKITEKEEHKKELLNALEKINNENKNEIIITMENKLNEIRKEKESLLKLKEIMNKDSKVINISNVYVYEKDSIKYLVYTSERPVTPHFIRLSFIDIFSSNEIDFKLQNKSSEIQNAEKIENRFPSLLVYPDKLVPEYELRELYYGINNIDINTPILKKIPENKKN